MTATRAGTGDRNPDRECPPSLRELSEPVGDLLGFGRNLVARGWTQQVYARSAKGVEVNPLSRTARSYCAVGALLRANWELFGETWIEIATPVGCEGSPAFVTAVALLGTAIQLVVVHPREGIERYRVWSRAALGCSPRGLIDVANDLVGLQQAEVIAAYDLAIILAAALGQSELSAQDEAHHLVGVS